MERLARWQIELLLGKNLGILATIREDGTPNVTPVWVDWDEGNIVLNTSYGRAKHLHLLRDPRCTILVMNAENPYEWVSVTGTAVEITEEGADEHLDRLAKRYHGRDRYPPSWRFPGEVRRIYKIKPLRVIHWDPFGGW